MKLALAQINPTVGDFEGNVQKIIDRVRWAESEGADLVCFSEMVITGYPPRDLLESPSFIKHAALALDKIVSAIKGDTIVCLGTILPNTSGVGLPLHNSAVVIQKGKVVFTQHKTLLPNYDVFDEQRYFEPASTYQLFQFGSEKIGITICEDLWFHEKPRYHKDPVAELAELSPTLVLNLSASPFALHKNETRLSLLQRASTACNAPLVFVNQVGGNDELVFAGGSCVVAPDGNVTIELKRFEEDMQVIVSNADFSAVQQSDISDVYHAIVLGLRDYFQKCGFNKAILGLSGGIDSSVVAALAMDALGREAVMGIAMPSPYSSAGSLTDAKQLAQNLGIAFQTIPIETVYTEFRNILSEDLASPPDLADENIQARIRGTILMTLSNRTGALVLSTGNKSEIAVGYCTLYGDMAGGLAILSDVPKMMVYELARYINAQKPVIPESVLTKAPSAELRPNQTDQDSLPPYEILDGILAAYIEQHLSEDEIVKAGFDRKVVKDIIHRIQHNEYKRRQAAPGIKITSKAFGMGRRLPIASKW
ncbi:MAG: NAD+ synthase [Deltaproteobacteria bacterium CG11_big_fil_rev_8_21_14_0_20_47_16]|nr:MAG: NAD+ synthase [Deltaproteobacteria bacterium CG11_big_fil_rev_8_21_14_0_20_47_16]